MLNYNMAHPAKVSKLLTANFTVMSSALQQSLLQYEKSFPAASAKFGSEISTFHFGSRTSAIISLP